MSENWTAKNIPDLKGKVIIITGANSGIGYEATKEFARKGAQIIMACRSVDKAQAALTKIQAEIPGAPAEIIHLDLASQKSVRKFAEAFMAKYDRLDILLNNAGIMAIPYAKTADGFEKQFGTNHLGHFALTGLVIDLVLKTPDSRVVNISSNAHRFGSLDFGNLMFEEGKDYSRMQAYGRSKLANLLFTYELQRRFESAGANAIAIAAHPGISATNLANHFAPDWFFNIFMPLFSRMTQSAAMGALPSIRAAVDPDISGGEYFGPDGPKERKGYPVLVKSNEASHNKADAKQLWDQSEALTKVSFMEA